jgi:pyridoxal phosphate enzyme (YggS family)
VVDPSIRDQLQSRLAAVEERIAAACRRAGRPRDAVTLVAVTKTVTPAIAAVLPELGIQDLGENRPQELWRKAEILPSVRWHLIGHLQRNKIERTLPRVEMIHSVDSLRLLTALEDQSGRDGHRPQILLEVNASGEEQKGGFAPTELSSLVPVLASLRHLQVVGLMTMAAQVADPQECRPTFALLRQLRDRLQRELDANPGLSHLSMGMTNDFEVAIEEGATLIRVGTALFEGLGVS